MGFKHVACSGDDAISARKQEIRRLADASAPLRRKWLARGAFFHDEDLVYLKFLIPEEARVLELGCGTGDLLAALKPSFGVGVDFSAGMIDEARKAHPDLTFLVGDIEDAAFVRSLPGPFDVIVVLDTLGDRKSTRLNSSHRTISYAVFCLKKKKNPPNPQSTTKKKNNKNK